MTNETSNRDGFAPAVNWNESCMRTQIEHGADIGSAGRAILADKADRIEQEVGCASGCGNCSYQGPCRSVAASGGLNVNGELGEAS